MTFKFNEKIVAIFIISILCITWFIADCNYRVQTKQSIEEMKEEILSLKNQVTEFEIRLTEIESRIPVEDMSGNDNTELEEEIEVEPIEPAFYLSDSERRIAECIVMGEARGESYEGQVLVAQCILNACLKDELQPSEVRKKYKYSGWHDNPSKSVKNAVSAVFDDGYKVTDEPIMYFYAPKLVKSKWHETQRFVIEVGCHRFFAER